MGKPSFFRSLVSCGRNFETALRKIYLVVPAAILVSFGSFAAKSKTSLSRNEQDYAQDMDGGRNDAEKSADRPLLGQLPEIGRASCRERVLLAV